MMDEPLKNVCQALKSIFAMLKPTQRPLSFVLLIGRVHQGKSTLLKQSGLKNYPLTNTTMGLFYHDDGVMLEVCEIWLSQTSHLLATIIKQLNRVHSAVRISGLALCVDIHGLMDSHLDIVRDEAIKHVQWVKRFTSALGYAVDTSVFFTKSDVLAGFVPFFHSFI